jgi:hypothetical protein
MVRLFAEKLRPIGVGDLGHVDVAAGIDRDAVRRDELAQSLAERLSPEMRQHLALRRHERHPWPEIGHAAGQRGDGLRAKLADDGEGILAPCHRCAGCLRTDQEPVRPEAAIGPRERALSAPGARMDGPERRSSTLTQAPMPERIETSALTTGDLWSCQGDTAERG